MNETCWNVNSPHCAERLNDWKAATMWDWRPDQGIKACFSNTFQSWTWAHLKVEIPQQCLGCIWIVEKLDHTVQTLDCWSESHKQPPTSQMWWLAFTKCGSQMMLRIVLLTWWLGSGRFNIVLIVSAIICLATWVFPVLSEETSQKCPCLISDKVHELIKFSNEVW